MITFDGNIQGLTDQQVIESRIRYGENRMELNKGIPWLNIPLKILKEPMIIMLLMAASIYFIGGNIGDGIFLGLAVVLVAIISLYQDAKSRKALKRLKDLTRPKCKVIRNGNTKVVASEELVLGDMLLLEEGSAIPADAVIVQANDFSVNESILTGESLPVHKDHTMLERTIYQGTMVVSGLAISQVVAIGSGTQLGKIGKSLGDIKEEKSPLELQINNFVFKMAILGSTIFLVIWGINFVRSQDLLDSLLKALTLAMSVLPEEIPVAFTTFMALGAWRLMKIGIIVKQMKTVETLGSATIICVDKTGTITENKMGLAKLYSQVSGSIVDANDSLGMAERELIAMAMWASEPIPFDPMEVALHDAYSLYTVKDERPIFQMVHEYPLEGKPPMMTHIFEDATGRRIIAAKGAPEALVRVSNLPETEIRRLEDVILALASDGYRVLGVGYVDFQGNNFPKSQQEFYFQFVGLIAFHDPPKQNIRKVFEDFYAAGIDVKIITGDIPATTMAIAKKVGLKGYEKSMGGAVLMGLSDDEFQEKVFENTIFTRIFPEAKLRIINALKTKNDIVAMTGDGVNDGPALKAAHIGIAMGKRGTEVAKEAASLILMDDDLSKMVEAVSMGRKIYGNLKKAVQYIISIHIPIILTVFLPLALGWTYPNIFGPEHVIVLELIMGPTCSIIFENEPMEQGTMQQSPRRFTHTFFNTRELFTSIVQGLVITLGTLGVYLYAVDHGLDEAFTRTLVFATLIASNIFLTLVTRSFYYSLFTTLKYRNNLIGLIITIASALTAVMVYIGPVAVFFGFVPLERQQLLLCIAIGFISVVWFEWVKLGKRSKRTDRGTLI